MNLPEDMVGQQILRMPLSFLFDLAPRQAFLR
jgi:hypothetical protein